MTDYAIGACQGNCRFGTKHTAILQRPGVFCGNERVEAADEMNMMDVESSDEEPDYVQLQTSLPKRGEKDFEPDGTLKQQDVLETSRQAMYQVLSSWRDPSAKTIVSASWDPINGLARVHHERGTHFRTLGKADSRGILHLNGEETLYLFERGSLELYDENNQRMDLPQAYLACIPHCPNGAVESFQCYAYLKRAGFIVVRHVNHHEALSKTADETYGETTSEVHSKMADETYGATRLKTFNLKDRLLPIYRLFIRPSGLVLSHRYFSFAALYSSLRLISNQRVGQPDDNQEIKHTRHNHIPIVYDLYKTRPAFKKSNPGPPDFYLTIFDAHETRLPSASELNALYLPQPQVAHKKNMQAQIKLGTGQIVMAVVSNGMVSFIQAVNAPFGKYPCL